MDGPFAVCRTGVWMRSGTTSGPTISEPSNASDSRFQNNVALKLQPRTKAVESLPWVSLGDEPFSPEGWDGDQAVKAGVNAPRAPLEQGGEGSGIAPGSAMAGFFSARVVRWTASHMPVDTAQNSASAMIRMSRSSRPASLI